LGLPLNFFSLGKDPFSSKKLLQELLPKTTWFWPPFNPLFPPKKCSLGNLIKATILIFFSLGEIFFSLEKFRLEAILVETSGFFPFDQLGWGYHISLSSQKNCFLGKSI